jgi:dihydrofolate reductase
VLRSFDAIEEPADGRHLYIIGGAQLYAALLPRCSELLLTRIDREVEGDTFFPEFENDFDAGEILESGNGYEIRRHLRK